MEDSAGLPVYADHTHGWHVVTGATGGYIVGFLVAAALVGLVLLQRSEGGVLGTGGGGFMSGRGQANFLTRTTAYLAMGFFATSITLTLLANNAATSVNLGAGAQVRRYKKPTFTKPAPIDLRHEISTKCDVVIEALAD